MKISIRTLLVASCLMGVCHGADESPRVVVPPEVVPEIPDQAIMNPVSEVAWGADETMLAFCKWFKPQEKGIKLGDKYKSIYFAIFFPEIEHYYATIYIYDLPADVAKSMQVALQKGNSSFVPGIKVPEKHTARIVANRLIIILAPVENLKFTEKLINSIDRFICLQ